MCIYEYDEEEHIRLERSYAWEDGKKEGLKEGIRKGEKGKNLQSHSAKNSRKEKLFPRLQTSLKIRKKISDA